MGTRVYKRRINKPESLPEITPGKIWIEEGLHLYTHGEAANWLVEHAKCWHWSFAHPTVKVVPVWVKPENILAVGLDSYDYESAVVSEYRINRANSKKAQ